MQQRNFGWFYARFPESNGTVLPSVDIFEMRALPPLPALADGSIRIRLSLIAVAPMARTYLELPGNDTGAEELGLKRTAIGSPLPSEYIAEVVESRSADFAIGDRIWGMGPLFLYRDLKADGSDQPGGMPPMKAFPGAPTEKLLSVVTPSAGVTAYCAVEHHPCGRVEAPFEERTVLVTSAAGAVGLVVGQLYKNKGCRVIGVTSSREKADRLENFGGYDSVIAYKSEDLDVRLDELAPCGIDVFIDNVGAQQLDAGTRHMKIGGKILSVGAIGEMDAMVSGNIIGMKEYLRIPARELTFGGFLMYNHFAKIPEAVMALSSMLAQGTLKSAETIVHAPFAKWAECVDQVYQSQTFGRLILSLE
jgi:NADPH-dependent curcumin reductase CurA